MVSFQLVRLLGTVMVPFILFTFHNMSLDEQPEQTDPFQLILEQAPAESFKITVVNKGKSDLVWDKEFSLFVHWSISYNKNNELTYSTTDPKFSAKNRMIIVKAGERYSKTVSLDRGIAQFMADVISNRAVPAQRVILKEVVKRYELAPNVEYSIKVIYSKAEGDTNRLLGIDAIPPDVIRMPKVQITSNSLVITAKK